MNEDINKANFEEATRSFYEALDNQPMVTVFDEDLIFAILYLKPFLGNPKENYSGIDLLKYWAANEAEQRTVAFVDNGVSYIVYKNHPKLDQRLWLFASKHPEKMKQLFVTNLPYLDLNVFDLLKADA